MNRLLLFILTCCSVSLNADEGNFTEWKKWLSNPTAVKSVLFSISRKSDTRWYAGRWQTNAYLVVGGRTRESVENFQESVGFVEMAGRFESEFWALTSSGQAGYDYVRGDQTHNSIDLRKIVGGELLMLYKPLKLRVEGFVFGSVTFDGLSAIGTNVNSSWEVPHNEPGIVEVNRASYAIDGGRVLAGLVVKTLVGGPYEGNYTNRLTFTYGGPGVEPWFPSGISVTDSESDIPFETINILNFATTTESLSRENFTPPKSPSMVRVESKYVKDVRYVKAPQDLKWVDTSIKDRTRATRRLVYYGFAGVMLLSLAVLLVRGKIR